MGAQEQLSRELNEQVVSIQVTVSDLHRDRRTVAMPVTIFRPNGKGPFPIAVVSHGRWREYRFNSSNGVLRSDSQVTGPQRYRMEGVARYLLRHNFIVLVPTRVGYGATAGHFDPELTDCTGGVIRPALEASGAEVLAAVEYARTLPGADPDRAILLGQSAGGMATVVAAATNAPGLVGAISFAGGIDGRGNNHGVPCNASGLRDAFKVLGKASRTPMLWIYTQNDQLFGPEYSQAWAKAYASGGAPLTFRLLPAFGEDGHGLLGAGQEIWAPIVDEFLRKIMARK